VTAASNVTGLRTPYHAIARRIHARGGWCIVDFAAAAPYVDIDMHPDDPAAKLDAVVFSPHKCLGGPGAAGLLVFDTGLCREQAAPDIPGGGTVQWTNPWGEHRYHDAVEAREDGGTPPFLQTIRAALALQLKEQMGVARMAEHEQQLLRRTFDALDRIDGLHVLAREHEDRLGIVSFWIEDLHYNLGVRLLNDRFGIQVRGGCSCAGTYGHYLLNVSQADSKRITDRIDQGDLSAKPGWIRLSLHPTLDDATLGYVLDAIRDVATHHADWAADYRYDPATNEFVHRSLATDEAARPDATVDACFAPLP
jgi:selenocysteine lyase/cysteine desulfurase